MPPRHSASVPLPPRGLPVVPLSRRGEKHATAKAGPLRLPSERLRRILAEASSSRLLRGASCSTSHGTWVGGNTGHDQCHERHR
jgi:hypothetical protein